MIYIEIPTWPFWKEKKYQIQGAFRKGIFPGCVSTLSSAAYWIESHRIDGIVDFVVSFGITNQKIWGVPTIGISNGYDFSSVNKLSYRKSHCGINLVAVASLRKNHGIDRVIDSLARYEGATPVFLHVAGEGEADEELHQLADAYGLLNKKVFFHGYLGGEELEELYAKADIGVSALGFYRYGVFNYSPLKTKEYLAVGLPCLGTEGEHDILCSPAAQFFCSVPNDETPIDMQQIIDFVQKLKQNGVSSSEIRNTGILCFDWNVVMQPVIKQICFDRH